MNLFNNKYSHFKYLTFKKKSRRPGMFKGLRVLRTQGAGLKRKLRKINFLYSLWNQKGCIISIDYEPTTKKLIALVLYTGGNYSYNIHIVGSYLGMTLISSDKASDNLGNTMFIQNLLYGSNIHNLEITPKKGAKLLRAPGSFGKILNIIKNKRLVKLKSGKLIYVPFDSIATIGIITDFFHNYQTKKKNAGYWRLLGWRPMVRGVAMNAVDHPHGGGKGKKSGNAYSMSPWGSLPKGRKTR